GRRTAGGGAGRRPDPRIVGHGAGAGAHRRERRWPPQPHRHRPGASRAAGRRGHPDRLRADGERVTDLDPEDAKLVTLARSARARTRAAQGAAVRDTDGRTYVAATVDLASLQLSALQVAVAMAVSS